TLYKLSLGHADTLQDIVSQLPPTKGLRPSLVIEEIKRALANTNIASDLERYVPFRFIAPWFEPELRGIKDSEKDRRIIELSEQNFGGPNSAPYCFDASNGVQKIRLDPRWRAWMRENLAVLHAFADHGLIQFLQARNPGVPGIPAKLSSASSLA
ncbi:MAG TPA: hypothetical protein VGG92_12015, partial [Caulobacteraceae bacterium]